MKIAEERNRGPLRVRDERPCRRAAAEQGEEPAPRAHVGASSSRPARMAAPMSIWDPSHAGSVHLNSSDLMMIGTTLVTSITSPMST